MPLTFRPPTEASIGARHHSDAAMGNVDVTSQAIAALRDALAGEEPFERILLKAAAGAGKSYALRRMVVDALAHPACQRIGVTALANKQVIPLAVSLGRELGPEVVCLAVAADRLTGLPTDINEYVTVATHYSEVPESARVVLGTTHKLEGSSRWLFKSLGAAHNGETLFDVLFVDEAWQLPLHRYRRIEGMAPITVGVGDVGQLPPLDPSQNPWRGDLTYNPYRAWPTAYEADDLTWSRELPAVWRPHPAQLALWREFYDGWASLDCVAAPGDRALAVQASLAGVAGSVWRQVARGEPTLLHVGGLPDAEAPDVDLPLLGVLEELLDRVLSTGIELMATQYDGYGQPEGAVSLTLADPGTDPWIAVLATRNQTTDDAQEMVERLTERHGLAPGILVASTVDSWQGQTNALTVAIHPLSGATALDDFNSAFGRLAVTCTRATHGLLILARAGLDEVLANAPARPGTPLGEPGTRRLPRQTHARILSTFAQGEVDADELAQADIGGAGDAAAEGSEAPSVDLVGAPASGPNVLLELPSGDLTAEAQQRGASSQAAW